MSSDPLLDDQEKGRRWSTESICGFGGATNPSSHQNDHLPNACTVSHVEYGHARNQLDVTTKKGTKRQYSKVTSSALLGQANIVVHNNPAFGDKKGSTLTGIFFILGCSTCFSLAAVVVRMDGRIPCDQIGFVRAVLSVVVGGALLRMVYNEPILPTAADNAIILFLFARGFVDFMASNLFYFGCQEVGLGVATMIMYLSPFWAAMLGSLWLGESYTLKDFSVCCAAFTGVVLSALPNLSQGTTGGHTILFMVFLASIFEACTYCIIKRIAGTCHFMQMTMSYGIVGAPIGWMVMYYGVLMHKPALYPVPPSVLLDSMPQNYLTPLIALFAILGQVMLNIGCSHVPASVAALIRTIEIPLAIMFQFVIFGQRPEVIEVAGAILVTCACVILTFMKGQSANVAADESDRRLQINRL